MTGAISVCSWVALTALGAACIQADRRVGLAEDTRKDEPDDATTTEPEEVVATEVDECVGCLIAAVCVEAGDANPENPCEACHPETDAFGWSAVPEERPCAAADSCVVDATCVGGQCVGSISSACAPPECTTVVCEGDANCSIVVSHDVCAIDGACYARGEPAPDNECLVCSPDDDQRAWSAAGPVACDDHDGCTYEDHCGGGVCAGTENTCEDPYGCTLDFCDGGQCKHQIEGGQCLIDDACYDDGGTRDDAVCRICDPDQTPTQWSVTAGAGCDDGSRCTNMDKCTATGVCVGTLVMKGVEPNETFAQAISLGEGVVSFPEGQLSLNLNPFEEDKDVYMWGAPLVSSEGSYRPRIEVSTAPGMSLKACVWALCGQSAGAFAAPTVSCENQDHTAASDGLRRGCCAVFGTPQGEEERIELTATCPGGGAVQQGLVYATIESDDSISFPPGGPCADYVMKWGTEPP